MSAAKFHVCIVGYGYWGPKLVRNFLALDCLVTVCEPDDSRRRQCVKDFGLSTWARFEMLKDFPGIDAVVIATPPATHFELAKQSLLAGRHVLVEKPLALNHSDALVLKKLAKDRGLTLMVDHTFLYHPAVDRIGMAIENGELGQLAFFESTRINLGIFQHDCDVFWDLAVHDVSILLHLLPERPAKVTAVGRKDIGTLTLQYPSGLFATINVSWLSPVKVRRLALGGTSAIVWDDLNTQEPVKLYDSGIDWQRFDRATYRTGDVRSPKIEAHEALAGMARDFILCCKHGEDPVAGPKLACDVVYVLQQAQNSLERGETVGLTWN